METMEISTTDLGGVGAFQDGIIVACYNYHNFTVIYCYARRLDHFGPTATATIYTINIQLSCSFRPNNIY